MTTRKTAVARFETGVRNLDAVFGGGIPKGSVVVVSGPPGSGKTILTQQICFHAASAKSRILYFNTLSEPTAKTLKYLKQFSFFDAGKLEHDFQFVDLGVILRAEGLEQTARLIMDRVKKVKPAVVVIDSFKAFDDLAKSHAELRKFGYEIGVNLMAWEATTFLLGEYDPSEYTTNPLFSVIDGLVAVSQRESAGEQQRFLQVLKLRGTGHSRDEHAFVINSRGIEVFAPRVTIHREARAERAGARAKTGIDKLDELLDGGIPLGSSLLVAGVAGTGKTTMLLELVHRGALAGERGILFSFEETRERLLATARSLGWEIDQLIEKGLLELVFIPQPEISIEEHLLLMSERVAQMGARRVAIDSVSVFLHKVRDLQMAREKMFQLASIVQNAGAVGFFATDIPYGSSQISRFGVEETVVDGVILLTSTEERFRRERYVEIYKLRNTAHLEGRHSMTIGPGGIHVFPRYSAQLGEGAPPLPVEPAERLPSGVPGLDALLAGGLLRRSATLMSGSPGIGKTTFGLQFVLEGAARGEPGVVFTLEEDPRQILATADAMGVPLRAQVDQGRVVLHFLPGERVRTSQFLATMSDRVRSLGARRVLVDGLSAMAREPFGAGEVGRVLYDLVRNLKALDATTMLVLESRALHFGDEVTEQGFSAVADNLLMLRYIERDSGVLSPALRIIKTRGSVHDRGTFLLEVGERGARVGPPLDAGAESSGRGGRGGGGR